MLRYAILLVFALSAVLPAPGNNTSPMRSVNAPNFTYTETFSDYANKSFTDKTRWDIWGQRLRLDRPDATYADYIDMALLPDDSSIVVWSETAWAETFAQRLDSEGNPLWQSNVRVNDAGSGGYAHSQSNVVTNAAGNSMVVWLDSRDQDEMNIFAQKLDVNGVRQWPSDKQANYPIENSYIDTLAVAAGGDNTVIIAWSSHKGKYVQKLDWNGNRLWSQDVQVMSNCGGNFSLLSLDRLAVDSDEGGDVFLSWPALELEYDLNYKLYAQKLSTTGAHLWNDCRLLRSEGSSEIWDVSIVADSNGQFFAAWSKNIIDGPLETYAWKYDSSANPVWATPTLVDSENGSGCGSKIIDQPLTIDTYADGGAVLTWTNTPDCGGGAYITRLSANGTKIWTSNRPLNPDSDSEVWTPRIHVTPSGEMLVAWLDDDDFIALPFLQKFSAAGVPLWQNDTRVLIPSGEADQHSPAIAALPNGESVIAWEDNRGGQFSVFVQKVDVLGTKMWPIDIRPSTGTGIEYFSDVASDASGNIYVTWTDTRNGRADIYAQRLAPDGSRQWAAGVHVDSNVRLEDCHQPLIGVSLGGDIYIAWLELDEWPYNLYIQKLTPGGQRAWAEDLLVSSDLGNNWEMHDLAVDPTQEQVFVTWFEHFDEPVYVQKWNSNGSLQWPSNTAISYSEACEAVSIAVGPDHQPVITCENGYAGIEGQKLNASGVSLWPEPTEFASSAWKGDIGIDSSNRIYAVYDVYTDSGYKIHAGLFSPAGVLQWTGLISIGPGNADAYMPKVAVGSDGFTRVVWGDGRNGQSDIYAQRFSTAGALAWSNDLRLVDPDSFYLPTGSAQSKTIDTTTDSIGSALLTAGLLLNGGTVQFYLSNNGGVTWEAVTPGVNHVFQSSGSDLRWKTVLTASPDGHQSPFITMINIDYDLRNEFHIWAPLVVK